MPTPSKKQIVYLLGAGATQAELDNANIKTNLLTDDLTKRVLRKARKLNNYNAKAFSKDIMDKYISDDEGPNNIEQLISLLESINLRKYVDIAALLRKLFREEIETYTIRRGKTLPPKLTIALIDLHSVKEVTKEENIKGILTTNYDNLIDIAFQKTIGKVDYGFNCISSLDIIDENHTFCPLLKLHGSFNWKNGSPIRILRKKEASKNDRELIWLPPGLQKETASYPFNILWGKATEILNCDTLRIIGSSLSQNDWGLLSLIFRTQLLNGYDIEIINTDRNGIYIRDNYRFLRKLKLLSELRGCSEADGAEISNPFKFWLQCQGRLLREKGIDIKKYKSLNKITGEGSA